MTLENSNASLVTENAAGDGANQEEGKGKKESDQEANDKSECLRRATRILRFIQLLVEGHYTPMQDHIREQKNVEGQANPKSFDFVA